MKLFVLALMLLVTVVKADISDSAGKFWDGDCQSDAQCVSVSHCLDKGNLSVGISAANRLIGEFVQSRRRPLLGPSPG